MWSATVEMSDVFFQDGKQVALVERDQVIQTVASDGSDQPFVKKHLQLEFARAISRRVF